MTNPKSKYGITGLERSRKRQQKEKREKDVSEDAALVALQYSALGECRSARQARVMAELAYYRRRHDAQASGISRYSLVRWPRTSRAYLNRGKSGSMRSPEQYIILGDLCELAEACRGLRTVERLIVIRAHNLGLSWRQIGEQMGICLTAVFTIANATSSDKGSLTSQGRKAAQSEGLWLVRGLTI